MVTVGSFSKASVTWLWTALTSILLKFSRGHQP